MKRFLILFLFPFIITSAFANTSVSDVVISSQSYSYAAASSIPSAVSSTYICLIGTEAYYGVSTHNCASTFQSACSAYGGTFTSPWCKYSINGSNNNYSYGASRIVYSCNGVFNGSSSSCSPVFSCDSGDLLSGSTCTKYVCSDNGILSTDKTQCTETVTTDSCQSLSGQSVTLRTSMQTPASSACYGTCTVHATVANGFPDDTRSYQALDYVYTGSTGSCQDAQDTLPVTNQTDVDAQNKQAAIDKAISDCGGVGHYTSGEFNGQTVISCVVPDTLTNTSSSATTTNPDGSTVKTDTTTTNSSNNSGGSTSVNSDGTTSGTSGGSSSSSTTTTKTTTTNPDGSSTTTEETAGDGVGGWDKGTGKDYLSDVFSASSISELQSKTEDVKTQIQSVMDNAKSLFGDLSVSGSGSYDSDMQDVLGATVDLSGKSIFDLLTQNGVGLFLLFVCIYISARILMDK